MNETKTVAMIVDNYFEQSELEETRQLLSDAGLKVDIVATKDQTLQAMDGDVKMGDTFEYDIVLEEADPDDYDVVVLPGGVINSDNLRMNEIAHQFLNEINESEKLIAAICHAPWVLISADLVEGRTLTSYSTLQHDLKNAGAIWIDKDVVVDGNLVTSRDPGDIRVFAETIIDLMEEDDEEE